jgi:tetratricopeptide (TPR) repeat protein
MKSGFLSLVTLSCFLSTAAAQDLDRGIELYRKNNFEEAESVLRKAVEQKSDDSRAKAYLGLTLLDQHKTSEAEPFLRQADESGSSGETKAALARLYIEQKDFDKADNLLKEADGPEAAYARGLLAFNRNNFQEATQQLESYLEAAPEHAYAHYYAGMAYNGAKRPDKMLNHFEMFLRLKPDAPEARKVRSVLRAVR